MTRTDDQLPSLPPTAPALPRTVDVAWECLLGATQRHPLLNGTTGTGPCHVTIRARLDLGDPDDARLDVVLEPEGSAPRALVERAGVRCLHRIDRAWTHLDVTLDDERVLAISLTADEQPDYVHSSLPGRAGFSPGMCEPPSITLVM